MFNDNHLYVAFRPFKFCKGYNESWIKETNKSQCVYFLVNNADGVNRKAEDIKSVNALFVDIDGTSKWNGSDGSVVVGRDETHWHCYWPLVEGEDMGKWKIAQKALIKHFGADPACSDLSRVMRVWGSVNRKPSAHGATYSVWKKEEKKWTIDEVVGFYGLDMSGSYNHDKIEISMEGVTCPTFVRDELKADIENKEVMEGYRYATARNWSAQALGAGMDSTEVHALATNALMRWGYDEDYAEQQATNAQSGTIAKIKSGDLKVDERLRPDLDFDDVEEEELTPEAVEAQEEELGCTSLVNGLLDAEDRFDWIKANVKKVAKLEPVELARIRDAWGKGVRDFNAIVKAAKRPAKVEGGQVFPAEDWTAIGEAFVPTMEGLVYSEEEFYVYEGDRYTKTPSEVIAKKVSDYLATCYFSGLDAPPVPIRPNVGKVANAVQQVKFATMRHGIQNRTWIGSGLNDGTPFKNGIMAGSELVAHTNDFFATYCLSYDYDESATCPEWEQTIDVWLDGDKQRIELLRQWICYLVRGRVDQQKIWVLSGVPRSGKGTITSLVRLLLGADNCSAPLMGQFVSDFGLENSVGKQAIIVGDAHVSKGDPAGILDKLKSISGKDVIQVNRKNKTQVEAQLGQLIIACNDMADIPDESNALISRYSILNFKKSFAGKEDAELLGRLTKELSGIYNWAIKAGDFNRFLSTDEETALKEGLVASANPVRAWARGHCKADSANATDKEGLYVSYESWCEENHAKKKAKGAFFKTLYQVFPYAKEGRKRDKGGTRVRVVEGIRVLTESSESEKEDFGEF